MSGDGEMTVDAPVATAWEALNRQRFRLLVTWWPWRCIGYLLCSPVVAFGWLTTCLPLGPWAGVPLGAVERWRLGWVDGAARPSPHIVPDRAGVRGWLGCRIREPATWQELLYAVLLLPLSVADALIVFMVLSIPLSLLLAPVAYGPDTGDQAQLLTLLHLDPSRAPGAILAPLIGLGLLVVALYLLTVLAAARVLVARYLLVGNREAQLGTRVQELVASRTRVVVGFESERRRIEHDLHDGAQQRITSLLMTLGLLQVRIGDQEPAIRALVDRAHDEAGRALQDLRDLVHGIYPATLRESGLGAVLAEIVDVHPLPVELHVDLPVRPPPGVEYTLYFAVCEALSNVAKHSRATSATVSVISTGAGVSVRVTDDGVGGADPTGNGLAGIVDRVEAYGGTVTISSPRGGPTSVTMEVPCGS